MRTDQCKNHSGTQGRYGRTRERGFTLIETAIASVVMFVVGLAAISLFLYANNYNSGGTDRALAIAVARQQMEQIRNAGFSDTLLTIPTGSTSATSTVTVSNGGKSYSVSRTVEWLSASSGCNAAKRVTVTVTPRDNNPRWGATPVQLVSLRSPLSAGPYIK